MTRDEALIKARRHEGRQDIWEPARLGVPADRVWEAKRITAQKAPGTLVTLKSITHYFQDFIVARYPEDPLAKFKLTEDKMLEFLLHVGHANVPYSTLLQFGAAMELYGDCLGLTFEDFWTKRVKKVFAGKFFVIKFIHRVL